MPRFSFSESSVELSQTPTPRTWHLPPQVKTLPINGYEMAYLERGTGNPMVLVHGGVSDYRHWLLQVRPFSVNYRTISVSLRHFYPERWNGDGGDFSVGQHVRDMVSFITKLNACPVHLVGHSLGGDVALLLASAHPDLLRSLVLVEPAPMYSLLPKTPETIEGIEKSRASFSAALECLQRGDLDKGVEHFIDDIGGSGTWEKVSERQKEIFRDNAWSIRSLNAAAQEPFTCADAVKINLPLLLVAGEKSERAYKIMMDALLPCLNQHEKITILNAPHAMNQAYPKAFNAAVLDFLARH
jgi:esterase